VRLRHVPLRPPLPPDLHGAVPELYETGEVFSLRETHDSYVLQHLALAKQANGKIEAPVSLSAGRGGPPTPLPTARWASGSTT
jgi:hypothetical protein